MNGTREVSRYCDLSLSQAELHSAFSPIDGRGLMRMKSAMIAAILSLIVSTVNAEPKTTVINGSRPSQYLVCDECSHNRVYEGNGFQIGNGWAGILGFSIPNELQPVETVKLELHSSGPHDYVPIKAYFFGSFFPPSRSELNAMTPIGEWYLYQHRNGVGNYLLDISEFVRNFPVHIPTGIWPDIHDETGFGLILTQELEYNSFYLHRLVITTGTVPEPTAVCLSIVGLSGLTMRRRRTI